MDLLLRRRSVGEPELMDDPACDPVALDNTYRLFGVINPAHPSRGCRRGLNPPVSSRLLAM